MRLLIRVGFFCALIVLASPVYFVRGVMRARRAFRRDRALRRGYVVCSYCHKRTPLHGMAECPSCGFIAPESLLSCSNCRARWSTISCRHCSATISV